MNIEQHYRDNYSKYVKFMARRFHHDKHLAEEVVQEAYTRAVASYKEETGPLDKWMNNMLSRCCRDLQNQERGRGVVRHVSEEVYISIAANVDVERDYAAKEETDKIRQLINSLDNVLHKNILSLYFFEGMTDKEIGNVFNIKDHVVRNVVSRFRGKL